MPLLLRSLLVALACAFCAAGASAQAVWTGAASDSWFDAANWSSGSVPGATTDVTIPNLAPAPRVLSGTALARNVDVLEGAILSVEGAATLDAMGDVTLLASGAGTGQVALPSATATLKVHGTWTQDDATAVTSSGGRVAFQGGAQLAGTAVHLPFARLETGTTTLLSEVTFGDLDATGGTSTGAFPFVVTSGTSTLASGAQPIHEVRIDGGKLLARTSHVDTLTVNGGELSVDGAEDLFVANLLDVVAGAVTYVISGSSKLRVGGALVAAQGVSWGNGFLEMDGAATTISGPGGTKAYLNRLRFVSGTTTLLSTVDIAGWVGSAGGATTGEWIEVTGPAAFLSSGGGKLDKVRVVGGQTFVFDSTVDEFELTGGTLQIIAGQDLTVEDRAELSGGTIQWNNVTTSKFVVAGELVSSSAVNFGSGFIDMAGTTTISGPGGAPAWVGSLRIVDGCCDLLTPVTIDKALAATGGTTTGDWFELSGTSTTLDGPLAGGSALARVRITAGRCVAESGAIGDLELTGGILEIPATKTLTVDGDAELLAGQLEFSGTTGCFLEVLGNVRQVATTAAVTMNPQGALRCRGVWTADGASDLGASFVEFQGTCSVTGLAAEFENLRVASGATFSMLTPVRVNGTLENAGGTTQGQPFEFHGPDATLATGDNAVHDVRIKAGVTQASDATAAILKLEGGELQVPGLGDLVVTTSLELVAGTLGLDPLDTGLEANLVAEGNVTLTATTAATGTGSGGTLRCEGIWFGLGPADFGASFVELAAGSTVLGGGGFGRLRVVEGAASLNVQTTVTTELVVEEDAAVTGFFPLLLAPGVGNTLALSGAGTLAELHVIDGTVEASGANPAVLRLKGGRYVAVGAAEAGDVHLEGGELVAREGGALVASGHAELTTGVVSFALDPGGATGAEARLEFGSLRQVGATVGQVFDNATLACRGAWTADAALPLGTAWVELGAEGEAGGPIGGVVPAFERVRVVGGDMALAGPVPVTTRLELTGGATSGDWWQLDGAELATGELALHRARITGGQVRAFAGVVSELELGAGELLVNGGDTLTVDGQLDLVAGALAFEPLARLVATGGAHQLGTVEGSVQSADASLTLAGAAVVDAPLVLGATPVELRHGATLTGLNASFGRLRVVPFPGQPAAEMDCLGGVGTQFEVAPGATFRLVGGGLVLLPGTVDLEGRLEVRAPASLALAAGTTLTVQPGGHLSLRGTPAASANLQGYVAGGYQVVVDGAFDARHFVVGDMGAFTVSASGALGPAGLHAGLFTRGLAAGGGPLVELAMPGPIDAVGLDFAGKAGDTNVRRPAVAGGEVTLRAYGGALGGAGFEDDPAQGAGDPDGLVVWKQQPVADLVALDVGLASGSAPEAVKGWPLELEFSVANQGENPAGAPWTDRVFLSSNDVAGDADDIELFAQVRASDVASGALYAVTAAPLVPDVPEGTYWLVLASDADGAVDETGDGLDNEANNSVVSLPFELYATPRPNLVANAIDGPPAANDGDEVLVTWAVTNQGLGSTDEGEDLGGTWHDRIYLSKDAAFGADDLLLEALVEAGSEPGGIAPGDGYQEERTVALPAGISGDHYLVVRADALDAVTPETQEADNVAVAAQPITISQPFLPNLTGLFEPVVSPLGALYVGTEVDVTFTVTNSDTDLDGEGAANGAWVDRLWLSFDTTIQPGIDTLAFEVPHTGLVGPTEDYQVTRTLTLPTIAGTWFLIGEADADDAVNELDETNTWFVPLSVVSPSWTGNVATAFTEGLASDGPGSQVVTLTGQSTQKGSAILVPNADLTVRVRRGDTRRVFEVTTDAIGAFTIDFEPMVGEAGTFELYCDHPAIAENPAAPEDSFVLHHLGVTPLELSASLTTGEVRRMSLGIENPGDQPLTNLTCVVNGLPAHLAVQNLVVPGTLAAGASDLVTFEVVALTDAPSPFTPATWSLDLGFDLAGTPTVTETVPVSVWVAQAAPSLVAVGQSPVVDVAGGGATNVRFHVWNAGGAALTGATLAIDGPASLGLSCVTAEPFQLTVPAALGDVPAGAARLVAFDVVAPLCADLALGATLAGYTVTVAGNEGSWSFPLDLHVVANPTAGLVVNVDDVGTWWSPGGAFLAGGGARVAGANVTLTDGAGNATVKATSGSGQAVFAGLADGLYAMRIDDPTGQHVPWQNVVALVGGAQPTLATFLPTRDTTYTLTAGDEAWTAAHSDLGPDGAARLRIAGGPLDLALGVGETAQFDLWVQNDGGATAEGVEWFADGFDDYVVEPAFLALGDLPAGSGVPLVVRVTRTGAGDPCDLAGVNLGARFFLTGEHAVWRWAPAFAVADEASCAPFVAGVAPPADLPAPLWMPNAAPPMGAGLASPVVAWLGTGQVSGAGPARPARALPPVTERAFEQPEGVVDTKWRILATRASVGQAVPLELELTNASTHLLGAVELAVHVFDGAGNEVTGSFVVGTPELVGIGALDGDEALGNLAPGATASASLSVAPDASVAAGSYTLGATLHATLEGSALALELAATGLDVVLEPRLEVEVLLPSRAHGDWSSTPLLFEAAEPFPIGLVVRNTGAGPAVDVALASTGPRFVADALGAPLFATALDLEIDGVPVPGGFALQSGELGDIAPGGERRILWTATASANAALLDLPVQLVVDGVVIAPASLTQRELVHATSAWTPPATDDGKLDWLVAADPAPLDPTTGQPFTEFATRVVMSDGTEELLQTHVSPPVGAPPIPTDLATEVTITSPGNRWHYLRFNDPGGALYDLVQVTRVQKAQHLAGLAVGGPGDVSRVWTTARPVDVTGDGVPDFTRHELHIVDFVPVAGSFEYQLTYVPGSSAALSADIQVIDASVGGTQHLTLDAGPAHAGEIYVLVGTMSGTQPGTPIGSVVAPINVDSYTLTTITNPAVQNLFQSVGVLDGQGRASAQIPVPAGFGVGAGITAHHAFVNLPLTKPTDFASNAVALFVLP